MSSTKQWLHFACKRGFWRECWAGGSGENLVGGHSVAPCTCRMWITSELKNCQPVHFSVFLQGVKLGRSRGCGVCGGKSGWLGVKGSLSAGHISWMFWEAVMETGEVRRPVPPPRVLAVLEQRKRERERESLLQYRMSSACSILTSVKTSLPQSSAAVPLLQVRR